MSDVKYYEFVPGETSDTDAMAAAKHAIAFFDGKKDLAPHEKIIRMRLSGEIPECRDRYFLAEMDGRYIGRLWYGYGRHDFPVGNFGNFMVEECMRGCGVGHELLRMFQEAIRRDAIPATLICRGEEPWLVELYAHYDFVPICRLPEFTPLYCPHHGSPAEFDAFARNYYQPAKCLFKRDTGMAWRHEIDCLLRYYLLKNRLEFGFDGVPDFDRGFLLAREGKIRLFSVFTESNRCVGWGIEHDDGRQFFQLHPQYRGMTPEKN